MVDAALGNNHDGLVATHPAAVQLQFGVDGSERFHGITDTNGHLPAAL